MGKAIGLVEYKTVSMGVMVADVMLKTANVEMMFAKQFAQESILLYFQEI